MSVVDEFCYMFRGTFGDYEPIYTTCPEIIFIVGPPGSGKTTIGKQLADRQNQLFISTGDLYRKEKDEDSKVYKFLNKIALGMKDKTYTPDDYKNCQNMFMIDSIIRKLLKEDLFVGMPQRFKNGIVIDGFRGSGDFEELKHYLPTKQSCIYLDAPEAVLVKRLEDRDKDDLDVNKKSGVDPQYKKKIAVFNKIYGKKIREDCKNLNMPILVLNKPMSITSIIDAAILQK